MPAVCAGEIRPRTGAAVGGHHPEEHVDRVCDGRRGDLLDLGTGGGQRAAAAATAARVSAVAGQAPSSA